MKIGISLFTTFIALINAAAVHQISNKEIRRVIACWRGASAETDERYRLVSTKEGIVVALEGGKTLYISVSSPETAKECEDSIKADLVLRHIYGNHSPFHTVYSNYGYPNHFWGLLLRRDSADFSKRFQSFELDFAEEISVYKSLIKLLKRLEKNGFAAYNLSLSDIKFANSERFPFVISTFNKIKRENRKFDNSVEILRLMQISLNGNLKNSKIQSENFYRKKLLNFVLENTKSENLPTLEEIEQRISQTNAKPNLTQKCRRPSLRSNPITENAPITNSPFKRSSHKNGIFRKAQKPRIQRSQSGSSSSDGAPRVANESEVSSDGESYSEATIRRAPNASSLPSAPNPISFGEYGNQIFYE